MPQQTWTAHVGGPGPGVAGTAYANNTAEADISPIPAILIPANFLNYPGAKLRLVAFGVFGTTGTPTLRLAFYPNGQPNNAFASTGDITTPSGVSNAPWRMEWEGELRTIGSSGTFFGSGFAQLGAAPQASTTVAAWSSQVPMPNTALATSAIDTTANNKITAAAKWGTASASNTITCHGLTVISLT